MFEEGFTCLDCGLEGECENLIYGSLDAWEALDPFCPKCESDHLKFYRPLEDKDDD